MSRWITVWTALLFATYTFAADQWWDGDSDGQWTDAANWVSGAGIPGSGDTANFSDAGGAIDTIDLSGAASFRRLYFYGAGLDSYTIGTGGAGNQTLPLSNDGTMQVEIAAGAGANQTVDANVDMVGAGGHINNYAAGRTLTINGDWTANGWCSVHLESNATVRLLGNNNDWTGLSIIYAGAVEANSMDADGKDVYVNEATFKLNKGQKISALTMGNNSSGNAHSTFEVVGTSVLTNLWDINYKADDNFPNTALIHGGDLLIQNNWRGLYVEDNPLVTGPELTISNNIGMANNTGFNLFDAGTVRLAGTNNINNFNQFYIREGRVQIEHDHNLGSGILQIGNSSTTGTVEFLGATETVNNAWRIGSGSAGTGGATFLANGSGPLTISANQSTHASADGARVLTLGGANTDDNTVSGSIYNMAAASPVSLLKTGAGTWLITGANSYSGSTTIEAGTLKSDGGGVPNSSSLSIAAGATFDLNGAAEAIAQLSGAGLVTNSAVTAGDHLSVYQGTSNTTFSGQILIGLGTDSRLYKYGDGTLTLTGDNEMQGTWVEEGTVAITTGDALGGGWTKIGHTADATVELVGSSDVTQPHTYQIGQPWGGTQTGGAVYKSSITGSGRAIVTASNRTQSNTATPVRTLTLAGVNTNNNELQGLLRDHNAGGSQIGLVKQGTGKWMLTTNNKTYTGTTTIQTGRLDIVSDVTSEITVWNDATIGGEGTTTSNLTFGTTGPAILAIDADSADSLATSAQLDVANGVTVLVEVASSPSMPIDVVQYSTKVGDETAFTLDAASVLTVSGRGASFSDTGSKIQLSDGVQSKTWTGSEDADWDIGTSANWTGESDSLYYDMDSVTFGDAGAGLVALQAAVAPASVTFTNTTGNDFVISNSTITADGGVTIDGTGDVTIHSIIAGSGALDVTEDADGATITLNGANAYSGGTMISAGTTIAGTSQAFGTGSIVYEDQDASDPYLLIADGVNVTNDLTVSGTGWTKFFGLQVGATSGEWSGNIVNNETHANSASWLRLMADTGQELILSGSLSGYDYRLGDIGTVTLSASNNIAGYSWYMRNWGNTLRLAHNQAAGGGLINMDEHGTLQLINGVTTVGDESVTIRTTGGLQKVIEIANLNNGVAESATLNGDILVEEDQAGNFDINATDALDTITLAGTITATNGTGVDLLGAGTKILTADSDIADALTISAGTLQIGSGGTTGSISNNATITNDGTLVLDRSDDVTQSVDLGASGIAGTGDLVKMGGGTLTLDLNNSYTGDTIISNGTVQLGAAHRISNSSDVTVAAGGILELNGFNDTIAVLSGSGLITNSGSAFSTLTVSDGGVDATFSGTIQRSAAGDISLTKNGSGTLTLTGTNTYQSVSVYEGTVAVTQGEALGSGWWNKLGHTSDGTLEFIGANDITLVANNQLSIGNPWGQQTAGGVLKSSLTGTGRAIVGAGTRANATPAISRTLTLTGANTNDNEITAAVADQNASGGTIAVTKTGAGKWILSAVNTYTDATTIQTGRLDVTGSLTSPMTVQNGGILGGEGSTTSNVTFNAGSTLAIDGSTAGAFATTGELDSTGGINVLVETDGTYPIKVIEYSSWNGSLSDFTLDPSGAHTTDGHGATFTSDGGAIYVHVGLADLTWAGADATNPTYWDVDTSTNWAEVDHKFLHGDSVTFADDGVGTVNLQATLHPNSVLFTNAYGNNYTLSGNALTATNGIRVSGSGNVTINSTIEGPGLVDRMAGTGGWSNSVVLAGANTYSGGTWIRSGVVIPTHSSAFGSGTVTFEYGGGGGVYLRLGDGVVITNDLTVSAEGGWKNFQGSAGSTSGEWAGDITIAENQGDYLRIDPRSATATVTLSGDITSTAGCGLYLSGAGLLVLSGNNNITDSIKAGANGSIARAASNGALGSAPVTMRHSNTELQLVNGVTTTGGESLIVDANANDKTLKIVDLGGAESATFSGDIDVQEETAGNFILDANTNDTLTISGVISGAGTAGITKTGAGDVVLTGANTITGGVITAEAGTLWINADSGGSTAPAVIASGGALGGTGELGGNVTNATGGSLAWSLTADTTTTEDLDVIGSITCEGGSALVLRFNGSGSTVDWADSFWDSPHTWTIATAGSLSGIANLSVTVEDWQDSNSASFNAVVGGEFVIVEDGNSIKLDFGIPADAVWTGLVSTAWDKHGNWNPGTPGTNNTATFNNAGNGNTTIDLGSGAGAKSIYFDTANCVDYTIGSGGAGGQTLNLHSDSGAATISIQPGAAGHQIIDANVNYYSAGHANIWQAGRNLTINGDITQSTGWMNAYVEAGSTNSWLGSNNTLAQGLSKSDPGALVVRSLNNKPVYVGEGTLVADGTMQIGNLFMGEVNADTDSTVSVSGTNTLQVFDLEYDASTNGTANTALVSGNGSGLKLGNWRWINVEDNAGISGPELTIENNITTTHADNGGINKGGEGTLRLSGTNSIGSWKYMYLREGTIQFSEDDNLTVGNTLIHVGYDDTDGTLEFIGGTEAINNYIRIGSGGTGTGSATLLANGTGPVTFSADVSTHAGANGARTLTLGGANTDDNTYSGVIDNMSSTSTVSVVKSGAGTWVLGGANAYTGTTTVSEGTLKLVASHTIPDTSAVTVSSGATLFFDNTWETIGSLAGGGVVTNSTTSGGNKSLTVGGNNSSTTFSGTLTESVGDKLWTISKNGTGTWTLTGTNYFNNLAVREGTVQIYSDGSYNTWADQIGSLSTTATLEFMGSSDLTYSGDWCVGGPHDNDVGHTGGAIFKSSLTDGAKVTISGGQGANNPAANRTLTLTGASTADNEITGVIDDFDGGTPSGGDLSLVKSGSGKWILSGANTYSGTTDVQAGELILSGTLSGAITVADGATLGGEASTSGNITFGTTGTTTLKVDGPTPGALASSATVDTSNGVEIYVEKAAGGSFKIFEYGTWTGDTNDFTIAAGGVQPGAGGAIFSYDGSAVYLDMSFGAKTWTGADASNPDDWDINTSSNWTGGADAFFHNGQDVTFGDAGAGTVDLQTDVSVIQVTFTNTSGNDFTLNDYEINSSNGIAVEGTGRVTINSAIAGAGEIVKPAAATNSLILAGTNTYTGGTTLKGGLTVVRNNQAFGTGPVILEDTAGSVSDLRLGDGVTITNALTINDGQWRTDFSMDPGASGTAEWAGDIVSLEPANNNDVLQFRVKEATPWAGSQVLTISGDMNVERFKLATAGVLNLTGDNTISGDLYLRNWRSRLRLGSDNAAGGGTIRLDEESWLQIVDGVVTPGTETLQVGDTTDSPKTFQLLNLGGAESATFSGNIALNENSVGTFKVLVESGDTLTLAGAVSGTGTVGIAKQGGGDLVLTGTRSANVGTLDVQAGTLWMNGNSSGTTDDLDVSGSATLAGTGSWGGSVTVASGGSILWRQLSNASIDGLDVGDITFAGSNNVTLDFDASGSVVDWDDSFWGGRHTFILFDVATATTGYGNLSLVTEDWTDSQGQALSASIRSDATITLNQEGNDVQIVYEIVPGTIFLFK